MTVSESSYELLIVLEENGMLLVPKLEFSPK